MDTNGSKNWMVYLVSPRVPYLKKGPLSLQDALLLVAEETDAGMLPLMQYAPDDGPQTWQGVELDEPLDPPE